MGLARRQAEAWSARYALHEGHTHELLGGIANVLGDPRIVGTSVATLRGVSVSYEAIENVLGLSTPCTIGLKAKGGEGEATPFDVVAIFDYFLALPPLLAGPSRRQRWLPPPLVGPGFFCDPTSLEKVAKMPPKGFVVPKQSATSWVQCPNSNSRGKIWPINTRESTLLNVVVERWRGYNCTIRILKNISTW